MPTFALPRRCTGPGVVPEGPDLKRLLTEGKVVIAGLGGDKAVLRAMQANEKVANKAYKKALEANGHDAATQQTLANNLEDERRHKAWIDETIEELKARKNATA